MKVENRAIVKNVGGLGGQISVDSFMRRPRTNWPRVINLMHGREQAVALISKMTDFQLARVMAEVALHEGAEKVDHSLFVVAVGRRNASQIVEVFNYYLRIGALPMIDTGTVNWGNVRKSYAFHVIKDMCFQGKTDKVASVLRNVDFAASAKEIFEYAFRDERRREVGRLIVCFDKTLRAKIRQYDRRRGTHIVD